MAPSAATEAELLQLPIYGKGSQKVTASVLHGPGDLRLVRALALLSYCYTKIWGSSTDLTMVGDEEHRSAKW